MEKILTVNDVAAVLQVKAITVREMFREKRLRGFKVGKSWRTTEIMLQEDINALARGEAPTELPSVAEAPGTVPPAAPVTAARSTPPRPAPKPEAAEALRSPRKSPATAPKEGEESGEDTQQLLF